MATSKPLAFRILGSASFVLLAFSAGSANAAPPIRTTPENQVPACVTPERLMAFVMERNPHLDPRFREIARWYKYYGEGWRVRWDYAFFQMVLETNYLLYRRGDGQRGDVWETQNNFAGIGATGGGVRGERFPDVKTGVHAQIQHLVAYSGEHLVAPIARRTRENQDDIISGSNRVGRPITFGDLARRWAADRAYGKSIDFVAGLFRARYCEPPASQSAESDPTPPVPLQIRREWRYPFRPPSGLGGPMPDEAGDAAKPKPAPARPKATLSQSRNDRAVPSLKKSKTSAGKLTSKKAKASTKAKAIAHASRNIHAPTSEWSSTTVAEPKLPAPESPQDESSQPTAGEEVAAKTESTGLLPWLPTFRIAPEPPQPSRLGGPVAAELGDAAKAAEEATVPEHCKVLTASYGGRKTLLIRSHLGSEVQYTALTIMDGFEKPMFEAYARTEAAGAEVVGEYASPESALIDAKVNCPADN